MPRYHIRGYDESDRLVTQYVVLFDSDNDFYNNHYALTLILPSIRLAVESAASTT